MFITRQLLLVVPCLLSLAAGAPTKPEDKETLAQLKEQNEQLKKQNELLKNGATQHASPFSPFPSAFSFPSMMFGQAPGSASDGAALEPFSLFSGLSNFNHAPFGNKLIKGAQAEPFSCAESNDHCVCTGQFKGLDQKNLKVEATGKTLRVSGGRHAESSDLESSDEDKAKAGGSFEFEQVLGLQFEPQGQPEAEYNKDKHELKLLIQMPKGGVCSTQGSSFTKSSSSFEKGATGSMQSFSSSSSSSSFGGTPHLLNFMNQERGGERGRDSLNVFGHGADTLNLVNLPFGF